MNIFRSASCCQIGRFNICVQVVADESCTRDYINANVKYTLSIIQCVQTSPPPPWPDPCYSERSDSHPSIVAYLTLYFNSLKMDAFSVHYTLEYLNIKTHINLFAKGSTIFWKYMTSIEIQNIVFHFAKRLICVFMFCWRAFYK